MKVLAKAHNSATDGGQNRWKIVTKRTSFYLSETECNVCSQNLMIQILIQIILSFDMIVVRFKGKLKP